MSSKWPKMDKSKRMPDGLRREVGEQLVAAYDEGASIRALCAETGYSIGRVRRLMEEAGVTYRSRGGRGGRPAPEQATAEQATAERAAG
jgi:hypothetical protein